nr:CidA/LrgA family protein [Metabacillus iocasae]
MIVIQISVLYGIYKLGGYIQEFFHIPIPGSIVGMVLLFLLLQTKLIKEKWLLQGSSWLLAHLPLLFVPATVGVMQYLDYFKGDGFISVVIVITSTLLVLVSTGGISQYISNKQTKKHKAKDQGASL